MAKSYALRNQSNDIISFPSTGRSLHLIFGCRQKVFKYIIEQSCSTSEADNKTPNRFKNSIAVLVRQRIINNSHRHDIEARKKTALEVSRLANSAGIMLLLVSSDFLASDHCYSADLARALERHARGDARLI